jgi:hypothetical protein
LRQVWDEAAAELAKVAARIKNISTCAGIYARALADLNPKGPRGRGGLSG